MSAGTVLEARAVSKRFGGLVAVNQVDLEVGEGEIVGLIGPNGAGKTTLMNVVSGLIRPDRGSVRLFGNEVIDLPPYFRTAFGMSRSFQEASLFAGLTVTETIQVALARRNRAGIVLGNAAIGHRTSQEERGRVERLLGGPLDVGRSRRFGDFFIAL